VKNLVALKGQHLAQLKQKLKPTRDRNAKPPHDVQSSIGNRDSKIAAPGFSGVAERSRPKELPSRA